MIKTLKAYRRYSPLALPIVLLAVPIMIQGVLMNLMGFVDALMIGQLGEVVISALGNVQQLLSFLFLLMAAFSIGGSVLIAQYTGAKNSRAVDDTALAMMQVGVIAGIVIGAVLFFFGEALVSLLTTDFFRPIEQRSLVPSQSAGYLKIVAFALPSMLLTQLLGAALSSVGDTKTPVKVGIAFNIVNFCLNYVLIFGMGFPGLWQSLFTPLGFTGAAIATAIAAIGQSIVLFYVAKKKDNGIDLQVKRLLAGYRSTLVQIFTLGYPNSVDGFYWQGARIFYTVLMNAIGAIAYAAYTIVRTLKSLFMLPISGLQVATAIRVGQLLGAAQFKRAKLTAIMAVMVGMTIMLVPASLLVIFSKPLLSLYAITDETKQFAYICTWILAASLFFTAINAVIPGLLRAGGDAKAVMNITLISFLACGAPLSWLFGVVFEFGLIGAFLGISIEEIFKAGLFVRRMRQHHWVKQVIR